MNHTQFESFKQKNSDVASQIEGCWSLIYDEENRKAHFDQLDTVIEIFRGMEYIDDNQPKYIIVNIFKTVNVNQPDSVKIMVEVSKKLCELPELVIGATTFTFRQIMIDQLIYEIRLIDSIKYCNKEFKIIPIDIIGYTDNVEDVNNYLLKTVRFINELYNGSDLVSAKMICNILDKLYYATDIEQTRQAYLILLEQNWKNLEKTHRFYLHRHFRLIHRKLKEKKIEIDERFEEEIMDRDAKWIEKNCIPSVLEVATEETYDNAQLEDFKNEFHTIAKSFFDSNNSDCFTCGEMITTDDKTELFKHYIKNSHMENFQNKLMCLYLEGHSETCAICFKNKMSIGHNEEQHNKDVELVCLSCIIRYRQKSDLNSHLKTKVHKYESLGLYDEQKSEAFKKQLIIREARKFAIHPKHMPKHTQLMNGIEDILKELEEMRFETEENLNDYLEKHYKSVRREMDILLQDCLTCTVPNPKLLTEYDEEVEKVEDLFHSVLSEVRPFYKLEKYKSEGKEKQFIESTLKSELVRDKAVDDGPFSASEDEDDIVLGPVADSARSASTSQTVAPTEIIITKPPEDADDQPSQAKTSKDSTPASPDSIGYPAETSSPKSPSTPAEILPADGDAPPAQSKGAIPKKSETSKLTPPGRSSQRDSGSSPGGDGSGSSPGGDGSGSSPGGDDDGDDSDVHQYLDTQHLNLREEKRKSFKEVVTLIHTLTENKGDEHIALGHKLEFFLQRFYFSDFIPLETMAACLDHFIKSLNAQSQ